MTNDILAPWWFLLRPIGYDGGPFNGYLIQAATEADAIAELGVPVESCERADDE